MKVGCWGPVVNCNVPKRGWMSGIGGCPNVGGICIGCTMPGFPDKFMPFMDEPPGAKMSSTLDQRRTAALIRALRGITNHTMRTKSRSGTTTAPRSRPATTRTTRPATTNAAGARAMTHDRASEHEPQRKLVEMAWDPITRIVGNLGIYTKIDFANREVVECKSTSSIFRGYSVFMRGKDPRDAHFITSRICGICGDNHATCSVYAQNMAYGIKMPPLAEWIFNLGEAAEYMFDHSIFQDNLVFVDFCEQMVRETNPSLLAKAERTPAPHAHDPRLPRRSRDIMRAFNPFTGRLYREALQMSRLTREMFCLMEGRHVHPSTLYPGGIGTVATPQVFTDYLVAADQVHRLREEARAAQRRPLRLLLRGAARLRGGRRAPHPARLLGLVPEPRRRATTATRHDRVGPRDVRHARHRRRRQARSRPTSSTSTSASASCSAARTTTTGTDERDVRHARIRSATRSTAPPVEPDDDPEAAEARPREAASTAG